VRLLLGSWSTLTTHGGERFASELAELYFLVRLNIAHIKVSNMISTPDMAYYKGIMAEGALSSATRSLRQDHWMNGYKYRPANKHLAKLRYRFALLTRLQGEEGTEVRALRRIEGALRLQQGDAAILKERENILAWMAKRHYQGARTYCVSLRNTLIAKAGVYKNEDVRRAWVPVQ
jgi:hypothetical protein